MRWRVRNGSPGASTRRGRADVGGVANLEGWLTTVVARICLDALKRREELTPDDPRRDLAASAPSERPEEEALLADSLGTALLILLDELVRAFLAASRVGNFSALLTLLDPGATLRADAAVTAMGGAPRCPRSSTERRERRGSMTARSAWRSASPP